MFPRVQLSVGFVLQPLFPEGQGSFDRSASLNANRRRSSNSLRLGKFVQVAQTELDQELFGGLVENRFADDVLSAGRGNELSVEQCLEHAGALYATDLHDLRAP